MRKKRDKYIAVVNASDSDHIVRDFQLPGGEMMVPAGTNIDLPAPVYLRQQRRNAVWMIRADKLKAQTEAAVEAAAASEASQKRGRKRSEEDESE